MNEQVNEIIFEKLIKVRIGEPLTAIALNSQYILFGSISGYLGLYSFQQKDFKYKNEVFEEIIRDIVLQENNIAYVSIGDLHGLKIHLQNFPEGLIEDISYIQNRNHNTTYCPNTLSFLDQNMCALLVINQNQNQNKLNMGMIDKINKPDNCFLIDLNQSDCVLNIGKIPFPKIGVPFDFNMNRFLWLEYLEKGNQELQIYDIQKKNITFSIHYTKKQIESISFGKLFKNFIVFVENQNKIKAIDIELNIKQDIGVTKNPIAALNYYLNNQNYNQEININIQQNEQQEINRQSIFNSIVIIAIDELANIYVYNKKQLIRNFCIFTYLFSQIIILNLKIKQCT